MRIPMDSTNTDVAVQTINLIDSIVKFNILTICLTYIFLEII